MKRSFTQSLFQADSIFQYMIEKDAQPYTKDKTLERNLLHTACIYEKGEAANILLRIEKTEENTCNYLLVNIFDQDVIEMNTLTPLPPPRRSSHSKAGTTCKQNRLMQNNLDFHLMILQRKWLLGLATSILVVEVDGRMCNVSNSSAMTSMPPPSPSSIISLLLKCDLFLIPGY
jgi:hypothetical protein